MPLSAKEITTAKKAYAEMQACDNSRTQFIFFSSIFLFFTLLFGLFFACGMTATDEHGKDLKGWAAYLCFISFFGHSFWIFAIVIFMQIPTYRRLKPRYADNLKLVTKLEVKYSSELPFGLENEIQKQPPKKALLWRLDAFLSRKHVQD